MIRHYILKTILDEALLVHITRLTLQIGRHFYFFVFNFRDIHKKF